MEGGCPPQAEMESPRVRPLEGKNCKNSLCFWFLVTSSYLMSHRGLLGTL